MKTSVLLLLSLSAAALITLNSNSGGPANAGNGNLTGGPGAAGNCSSCHSGGTGTTMNISLRKKSDNTPVSGQYSPGVVYTVKVSGNHASLTGFGFQIMATKANNSQAGTFSNLGTNYHTKLQGGITLVEHHHVLNKTGSEFVAEFDWTAPAAGTGNVSFYGALNAVNKNGSTSGDAPSPSFNMTLSENPVSVESIAKQAAIRAYPNPAASLLHVELPGAVSGNLSYAVYDLNGKMQTEARGVNAENNQLDIRVQELAQGLYFLRVANGSEITTIPFAKQ